VWIKNFLFYILFKEAAHVRQASTISNQTQGKFNETHLNTLLVLAICEQKESKTLERTKSTTQIKQNGHTYLVLLLFFLWWNKFQVGLLLKPLLYVPLIVVALLFWRLGLCVWGVVDMWIWKSCIKHIGYQYGFRV